MRAQRPSGSVGHHLAPTLAALLYTASRAGNDSGMPWVRQTAAALRRPAGWKLATEACANINPLVADWLIPGPYDQRQRLSIAEALVDATRT